MATTLLRDFILPDPWSTVSGQQQDRTPSAAGQREPAARHPRRPLTLPFLRFQAFVNGLLPECGVAQPYGGVHPDVFQKQRQHVKPLLVRPEHLAFDQFDFLRAEFTVLLLNLGTAPFATLTLDVEFHACASWKDVPWSADHCCGTNKLLHDPFHRPAVGRIGEAPGRLAVRVSLLPGHRTILRPMIGDAPAIYRFTGMPGLPGGGNRADPHAPAPFLRGI